MSFKRFLLIGATSSVGVYASAVGYAKWTMGECHSNRDLKGRTVIVTGANTGIGKETARDLAARNAKVILACRSLSRGEEAMKDIVHSTGNSNVVVKEVDLSSLQSVRAFAKDILKTEERLDVLVNNAGVLLLSKQEKTADGLDPTFATNHLGPFLLTNLLLPKLKESAPSRIVVVSSDAYKRSRLNFDDMNNQKPCEKKFTTYSKSKLANLLFTQELSERLKGTGVTVNTLHPGLVETDIFRNFSSRCDFALKFFLTPFLKTPKQGAQTSIHVAVSEELEGVSGKYFSECKEVQPKKFALDSEAAKKLWKYSEEVTKLNSSTE